MKNFRRIFAACIIMLSIVGCSKDEQNSGKETVQTEMRTGQIVSPKGYVMAESMADLKTDLFGSLPNITIVAVEFLDSRNDEGAAAIIKYVQGGVSKNLGYAMGKVVASGSGPNITTIQSTSTTRLADSTTFKCGGQGCCYVGGTTDLNTGAHSFYCKCEGNPNGNSGCSLTVETTKSLRLTEH